MDFEILHTKKLKLLYENHWIERLKILYFTNLKINVGKLEIFTKDGENIIIQLERS